MNKNEYYGYVSVGEALYHEGVKGMAWGVRNGPPYPLNYEGKASLNANKKILGSSSDKRSYGINGSRHYGVNKKIGNAVKKASTDRTALNKKLVNDKIKGQEDKVRLNKARHVGKSNAQQNKADEKLQKLENKQRINDARHKGSIEFRMRQDSLRRAQMKTELMRQKAEQQNLKNEANKEKIARKAEQDKIKMASKAEQDRIKAQIKASKAEAKANLKLEKEKLRMEDKAKARETKMAEKQQKFEQKQQQKADERQQRVIVTKGNKNLLNRNDIINSGDPKLLKKYGKYLNNDEYKLATERIKQVNDLKSAKMQNFIDKGQKIATGAQNVANFTKSAVETWNNVAKAHNTLSSSGKQWKVINTEGAKKAESAKDAADRLKNEIIRDALNTPEGRAKYRDAIMRQFTSLKDDNSGNKQNSQSAKPAENKPNGESSKPAESKPASNNTNANNNSNSGYKGVHNMTPIELRSYNTNTGSKTINELNKAMKELGSKEQGKAFSKALKEANEQRSTRIKESRERAERNKALEDLLKYGRSKGW